NLPGLPTGRRQNATGVRTSAATATAGAATEEVEALALASARGWRVALYLRRIGCNRSCARRRQCVCWPDAGSDADAVDRVGAGQLRRLQGGAERHQKERDLQRDNRDSERSFDLRVAGQAH